MRLLFAEDDRDLSAAVKTLLERNGYLVDAVYDGEEAVSYAGAEDYDGMILDWMMPEKDGIRALQEMRKKGIRTPCMMLTARDAVEDRVAGLDAGADDYLPKPFDMGELLARIRAMLRRREEFKPNLLSYEDLTLNVENGTLSCGENSVILPKQEYRLMEQLMLNHSFFMSTEDLLEKAWGFNTETDINSVWLYISYLRKRLSGIRSSVEIVSRRNFGYKLEKGS